MSGRFVPHNPYDHGRERKGTGDTRAARAPEVREIACFEGSLYAGSY